MRLALLVSLLALTATAHAQTHIRAEVSSPGPHVVLVPGLGSGPTTWAETVPSLGGYTVHRVTLAGFAGVPRVEADSSGGMLDAVRDELAAYVAALDGPAVLVGHSLGGWTAVRTAALQPDNLVGVVVVDSPAFLAVLGRDEAPDLDALRGQFEAGKAAWVGMTGDQVRAHQAGMLAQIVTDPADAADLLEDNAVSDPAATYQAFVELMTTDARPDLERIVVPALVVLAGGGYVPYRGQAVGVALAGRR